MEEEDAAIQLELLGHNFYVFRNAYERSGTLFINGPTEITA